MAANPEPGVCRCGGVRFEVAAPPIMTAACHCRGCQRMSASAFSLTAMVPADALHLVAGETVKGGAPNTDLDHLFCPDCKTWLFTRIRVEGFSGFVNVRPTMFDAPRWATPFIETMTAHKLAWASTPARHSYEGFPEPAEFPSLVEAFAAAWAAES